MYIDANPQVLASDNLKIEHFKCGAALDRTNRFRYTVTRPARSPLLGNTRR